MAKAANPTAPAVLAAYDVMIAGVPGVARKGAAMPYTSINGNMYSMINKADVIGLRLSIEDRAAFVAAYGPSAFEGTPGYINKDYVAVPSALLDDAPAARDWFRGSHAFAVTLKPKKTTR